MSAAIDQERPSDLHTVIPAVQLEEVIQTAEPEGSSVIDISAEQPEHPVTMLEKREEFTITASEERAEEPKAVEAAVAEILHTPIEGKEGYKVSETVDVAIEQSKGSPVQNSEMQPQDVVIESSQELVMGAELQYPVEVSTELRISNEAESTEEVSTLVSDEKSVSSEETTEIPAVIIELLQEAEADNRGVDVESILVSNDKAERAIDTSSETTSFAERLSEYIESLPKNPELVAEEQPAALMENILEKAEVIQSLRTDEKSEPEALKEIEAELEVLCKKLLESLGVESDEEVIVRLVEKILASENISEISHKKLSLEELAKQGTHEYKLENWFNKFKQLLDDSTHPHRLVGRVALGLTNVPV